MKKVLSFDIGGTNTRLALINEKFEVEKELINPTPTNDKEKFMENVLSMIKQFDLKDVVAVGAGVPGVVDRETKVILDLPNVGIKDIDFGDKIKEKFNLPVFLRNDAEVACLGEAYLGAGKDYSRVFFITISTGLGGAMCVDCEFQDYITEIGHTLFLYKNRLEEYSIISGILVKHLAELNGVKIENARDLFARYEAGEEGAKKVYEEWIEIFNKFIHLVSDSYSPDIIVMTGGLMKQKQVFFNTLVELNPNVLIKECEYSEKAGLMGSACFAFKEMKII